MKQIKKEHNRNKHRSGWKNNKQEKKKKKKGEKQSTHQRQLVVKWFTYLQKIRKTIPEKHYYHKK